MAMPQRDNVIEEIKRLEPPTHICFGVSSALLECTVRLFPHLYKCGNGLMSPKTRLREELKRLTETTGTGPARCAFSVGLELGDL